MRRIVSAIAVSAAIGYVLERVWRRDPRLGTRFVNTVVNPALLDLGLAGRGRSEIGMIEHIGRRTGTRRLTPVHPEVTEGGFRVLVPLGMKSEWARNVLTAGRCRLYLHDEVYDLDEAAMVPGNAMEDLPGPIRRLLAALGFQYLSLRSLRVSAAPGGVEIRV